MRKSITLLLLALLIPMASFALNLGDYVFTSSARYKIVGENICLNGQFDGYTNWEAVTDTLPVDQCFSLEASDGTYQGYSIKSLEGGNAAKGFYQRFTTEPGASYVVSFKIRNTTGGITTSTTSGAVNYVNVFVNNTGNVFDQAEDTTNNITFTSCGTNIGVTTEWQTVSFAFTDATGEAQFMFFEVAGIATDTEIAEVEVHKAISVYDIRIAKQSLDYAKFLLDQECFPEGEDKDGLREMYNETLEMYNNANDDMTDQVAALDECINYFLEANTEDYYAIFETKGAWDNSYSLKSNRGSLTSLGNWSFSGSWGTSADTYPIKAFMPWAYEFPNCTATHSATLPAGKYMMEVQALGGRMSGNSASGLNYVQNPSDTIIYFRQFVNNDSTEAEYLSPSEYKRYIKFFDVADGNVTTTFGYNVYQNADNGTRGGNVNFIHNKLLRIKGSNPVTLEQQKVLNNVNTQLTALQSRLETATAYYNNPEYPWDKAALKAHIDEIQIIYDTWKAKSDAEIIEYWGEGEQSPADTLTAVVRLITNTYIGAFTTANDPVVCLKPYLTDANETYADPANKEGDLATYKKVIDAAQKTYDKCFTTTESNSEDSLACREAVTNLINAKETLKASIAKWGNPCEMNVLNPNFETNNGGKKGTFAAEGWEVTNENTTGGWSATTMYHEDWASDLSVGKTCINFWRGNTAFPKNKCRQTIELTYKGMYVLDYYACAYNEVASKDKTMYVYGQEWDPDWGEWITTDSVVAYNSGCRVFLGPDGTPDSLDAHKSIYAANLLGTTIEQHYKASTNIPVDHFELEYEKKEAGAELFELGFDCLNNVMCNTGRFGQVRLLYYGDAEKYRKDRAAAEAGKKGDADEDGTVTVTDITTIASYILGNNPSPFNKNNADVDGDGDISVSDITKTASIILGN